ncbi:LOW QUALITY PROTEIN: uncharacterized protein EMH_0094810 [Eimeria mitis]|uniref:C3H1-type domain-containing protein n=1 Tax=Eimeria mitis TaxID=44415 RepID=U6KFC3_9EIME|nr:LOW QUALITY PROTEIN: uncharacterized protein EMH_0094810 [Eimeria mitis]CDJ36735.1 hypothetical protein, conserved [Eimeria mitis]
MGTPGMGGLDWQQQQQQQHQQQQQQMQMQMGYGWGPTGAPFAPPVHQHPQLRAPEGFYSAQGPTVRVKRGPPEGPQGSPYAPQGSPHGYGTQGPPNYYPQGPPGAGWQQQQPPPPQQQQQYGPNMWVPPGRGEGFLSAGWQQSAPYGGPRPPGEHPHHAQQPPPQLQQAQQPRAIESPGAAGVPPPPGESPGSGGPLGSSSQGSPHPAEVASGAPGPGGPPPRACKEFLMGGRCSRGPACLDLHIPPQAYHKFNPHTLLLLGAFMSEAPELRRQFAADGGIKQQQQQQQQQQQEQQRIFDQQQQQTRDMQRHPMLAGGPPQSGLRGGVVGAPPPNPPMGPPGAHPVYGGPPFVSPHRPAAAPMVRSYPAVQGDGGRDMQQYTPVYGAPMQEGGGSPFRPPPASWAPPSPLPASRHGATGGPCRSWGPWGCSDPCYA